MAGADLKRVKEERRRGATYGDSAWEDPLLRRYVAVHPFPRPPHENGSVQPSLNVSLP